MENDRTGKDMCLCRYRSDNSRRVVGAIIMAAASIGSLSVLVLAGIEENHFFQIP